MNAHQGNTSQTVEQRRAMDSYALLEDTQNLPKQVS